MAVEVGVARESAPGERRVALTPETCRKLVKAGAVLRIERGAGAFAGFPGNDYADAGAQVVDDGHLALNGADIVLCVQPPDAVRLAQFKQGAVLVGLLQPQADASRANEIRAREILAFPLERLPRTTRAQSMDTLSPQAAAACRPGGCSPRASSAAPSPPSGWTAAATSSGTSCRSRTRRPRSCR